MGGDGELVIELHLLGLHGLEQQVERHHLGERSGIGAGVRVRFVEHAAALGIDDDRGRRRYRPLDLGLGLGAAGGHIEGSHEREQHRGQESAALRSAPLATDPIPHPRHPTRIPVPELRHCPENVLF
jgi:hypothetical protein